MVTYSNLHTASSHQHHCRHPPHHRCLSCAIFPTKPFKCIILLKPYIKSLSGSHKHLLKKWVKGKEGSGGVGRRCPPGTGNEGVETLDPGHSRTVRIHPPTIPCSWSPRAILMKSIEKNKLVKLGEWRRSWRLLRPQLWHLPFVLKWRRTTAGSKALASCLSSWVALPSLCSELFCWGIWVGTVRVLNSNTT